MTIFCLLSVVPRNYDPKLHPFEVPREYQRALNAVKLDKVFAKPFLGALDGHSDVVQCMIKHPTSLSTVVSGACDGQIRIWNVPQKKCTHAINAHNGIVRGLCAPIHGRYFFSVDNEANIKQWPLGDAWTITNTDEEKSQGDLDTPINTIIGRTSILAIDHHYQRPLLVTSGEKVEIWEENRSDPIQSYSWGVDSVSSVKFNPVELDIVASTASDRSITLYDIRKPKPLRKVIMALRANTVAWNPMEAFNFTAASEDYE